MFEHHVGRRNYISMFRGKYRPLTAPMIECCHEQLGVALCLETRDRGHTPLRGHTAIR